MPSNKRIKSTYWWLGKNDACFLGLPVVDTLWSVSNTKVTENIPRETVWKAQTPQAFKLSKIYNAYKNTNQTSTDDVGIAHAAGIKVTPIIGSEKNIKITNPEDFNLAEQYIGNKMDIRVGNGFDVHALGIGSYIILNGIKIPHTKSMIGHSVIACIATSASEWPSKPYSWLILTPPIISGLPNVNLWTSKPCPTLTIYFSFNYLSKNLAHIY